MRGPERFPKPPLNGTPLWVAAALVAVFGCTMLLTGYMLCRLL